MKAATGDRIVTASGVVGGPVRDGVIVETRGPDGTPPYRVRWSDTGEETLVFPGPDSFVDHSGAVHDEGAKRAGEGAGGESRRTLTWQVQVTLVESSGSTTAEATVVGPTSGSLRAVGHARKAPQDEEIPAIGDELAAARALRRLADRLLEVAEYEIAASTGHAAHVHS
ncbi:DUF1876 family protein [Antribacter sp. KLBMP9083]|uniref:DUF1876 family protein n=1 Tax=Antribacter soli TaxID=2910976 RepID=A0AA41QG06_9MICO|nr:dsRBD fold-containing protein [Antribacter soli]MCF4122441.1 DUF1876 family protein [Antribacter soli]